MQKKYQFGIPTALVIASKHKEVLERVRQVFMNENLRIYMSDDLRGAELRRSIKKYYCFLCWNSNRIKLGR